MAETSSPVTSIAIESARRAARVALAAQTDQLAAVHALSAVLHTVNDEAGRRGVDGATRIDACCRALAILIATTSPDESVARERMRLANTLADTQLQIVLRLRHTGASAAALSAVLTGDKGS